MPNRDGTGPEGKGPRTGRGLGNCPKTEVKGTGRGPCGNGIPRGGGRGRARNKNLDN